MRWLWRVLIVGYVFGWGMTFGGVAAIEDDEELPGLLPKAMTFALCAVWPFIWVDAEYRQRRRR